MRSHSLRIPGKLGAGDDMFEKVGKPVDGSDRGQVGRFVGDRVHFRADIDCGGEVDRVDDTLQMSPQSSLFNLSEDRQQDRVAKELHRDLVFFWNPEEHDDVAGGDVSQGAEVIGDGPGGNRIAIDDDSPVACGGTCERDSVLPKSSKRNNGEQEKCLQMDCSEGAASKARCEDSVRCKIGIGGHEKRLKVPGDHTKPL